MTFPRRTAVLAAAVLSLAACSGGGGITIDRGATTSSPERSAPTGGAATPGALAWGACKASDIAVTNDAFAAARRAGLQCATLDVPVDHARPDGATTELAVGRLPATGARSDRIGSLIVNPGGPGGSGLEFLAGSGPVLPEQLRRRFDLVSFDPRGIAASSPLDCLTQAQRKKFVDEPTSHDPATAQADADEEERTIAAGCARDDKALYEHMGTDQVAADLDDLRAAVGDERLTFLGLSYGTRIAAAYATEFPDKVRALVLDGSVTPSRDLVQSGGVQLRGISRALQSWVDACDANPECPLAPDAMGKLLAVRRQLDSMAITVRKDGKDESLTGDKFVTALVTSLYDPSTGEAVADAVDKLATGTKVDVAGSFLLGLAGQQSSQEPDGSYGNGFETQSVVNCLDADGPLDQSELPAVRQVAGPIPPVIDADPALDTPECTHLPTGDRLRIGPTPAADRLLVVGTRGDPATPYEWTGELAGALGVKNVLTYEGGGHTASLNRPCVTDQVTHFFEDLVAPSVSSCPRDVTESDIYAQVAAQFEAMGVAAGSGECIATGLRGVLSPLDIVSLDAQDPDPKTLSAVTRVVLGCR